MHKGTLTALAPVGLLGCGRVASHFKIGGLHLDLGVESHPICIQLQNITKVDF